MSKYEHKHKEDYLAELEWMVKFADEVEPAIRIAVLDEAIEAVKTIGWKYDEMPNDPLNFYANLAINRIEELKGNK